MPYKEPQIEKLFYSIGEVAEIFGENTSLIRFWANKFAGVINPVKNKKGNRMFTPRDLETLKLVHHLIREKGMTLDGARKRLEENREGEDKSLEITRTLEDIKQTLLEIKELL
jgi:DNA-binding transcriptional MerR regulator